jgi:hypothetical protein
MVGIGKYRVVCTKCGHTDYTDSEHSHHYHGHGTSPYTDWTYMEKELVVDEFLEWAMKVRGKDAGNRNG